MSNKMEQMVSRADLAGPRYFAESKMASAIVIGVQSTTMCDFPGQTVHRFEAQRKIRVFSFFLSFSFFPFFGFEGLLSHFTFDSYVAKEQEVCFCLSAFIP